MIKEQWRVFLPVFGHRNTETIHARGRTASEKCQSKKLRTVVQRDGEKADCFSAVRSDAIGTKRTTAAAQHLSASLLG
jgi:hypothetical protein